MAPWDELERRVGRVEQQVRKAHGLGRLRNESELLRWLKQRFPDLGIRRLANLAGIDFGAATVSFVASATGTGTIAHQLKVAPAVVIPVLSSSASTGYVQHVSSDADSFDVRVTLTAAITGDRTVYWLALV